MLADLDAEHAQKVLEMEHAQQAKLKERQKYFEEAFQQDMEQYLSTGYLRITDRRGEALSDLHSSLTSTGFCSRLLLTRSGNYRGLNRELML
ncbi:dysbindin-A isoform X1 [Tachysurus ichikawai]